MKRLLPVAAAVLAVAACGPTPITPNAARTRPTTTAPAPVPPPGVLHVAHTPGVVVDDMHLRPGQCHAHTAANGQPLPDPACTPGAVDPAVTQANLHATICATGYTTTVRPPESATAPAKRASEAQYGIASGEYDHLVPLELGGASATSNLWVEPGPIPNVKDSVESTLHAAVCAGRLTLARAQAEIAADWTTAR